MSGGLYSESDVPIPGDDAMREISALAERQVLCEADVASKEAALSAAKLALRKVQEVELPEAMLAAGIRSFTMKDGKKVSIDSGITASVSAERRPAICEWLRTNGFGDIVHDEVGIIFGRGEENAARETVTYLTQQGLHPSVITTVNTTTLKALIREQMEQGKNMPLELLGAYAWRRAKIKE